jgi:predicted alpha/beta-hydrolase family hydrolase
MTDIPPLRKRDLKHNGRRGAPTILLTHGAGGPVDAPFFEHMARGLAKSGLHVVRFELDYMRKRRVTGIKAPPDREEKLLDCWRRAASLVADDASALYIGGKSMGGRMASLIADELGVAGLVCLGYPFHPPGKPEKLRTAHLAKLKTRALILQGERDAFGDREEVAGYKLSRRIRLRWLEDGDHSLAPRKKSGRTVEDNLDEAVSQILRFIAKKR